MPYFRHIYSNTGNLKKSNSKSNATIPEAQDIKGNTNAKDSKQPLEEKPIDIKVPLEHMNIPSTEFPMNSNPFEDSQMYGINNMPYMQSLPFNTCPYLMHSQMLPEIYNTASYNTMEQNIEDENSIRPAGDPPPILSNNPPVISTVLFKELTGYPNYGNPSRNADILYTGNMGTWTFQMPSFQMPAFNRPAQVIIRAVLDDHNNVPVNRYSARISINDRVVHNGPVSLDHGIPKGSMFTNWTPLTFTVNNIGRMNRIAIENTSRTGPDDWMAFDWIEIRIPDR